MGIRKRLPWSQMAGSFKANLVTALLYYGLAELSRHLASTPNSVTPVWPPDGLAVFVTFLYGNGMLPGVFWGSFLANIQAFWNPQNGIAYLISVLAVVGIASGTALGTWFGTTLLRRTVNQSGLFDHVPGVIKFLVYAGLVGPMVNATVGVAMLVFAQKVPLSAYSNVWLVWWISNVAGIFILTPLLLTWNHWLRSQQSFFKLQSRNLSPWQRWSIVFQKQGAEILLLAILILLTAKVSFWNNYPVAYILIPLLVWAAFRFGQLGATLSVFIISAIAILGTVRGLGTFASSNLNQALMGLQSFIAVIVFTSLILVAVLSEQAQAKLRLKEAFSELQITNGTLEKQTQELADNNQQLEQTLRELKIAQAQMIQSEKMSTLGNLMAGVAHEINNPISFLSGSVSHAEEYVQELLQHLAASQEHCPNPAILKKTAKKSEIEYLSEDLPCLLESMQGAIDRITSISNSLRTFSRADVEYPVSANLHEGLDSTLFILKYRLKANDFRPEINVVKNYGPLPPVECFLGQLNQVFMNILVNAIDALDEFAQNASDDELEARAQKITILTRELPEQNAVEIRITDNANGMTKEVTQRIFDHLFTTKSVGKGTGLGLAIAFQIVVEKHHGKLEVQSKLGQGTEFRIQLPIEAVNSKVD